MLPTARSRVHFGLQYRMAWDCRIIAVRQKQASWCADNRISPHFSLQDVGIGFILVIDRRQDKWTSVKASVLRIAVSAVPSPALLLASESTLLFSPVQSMQLMLGCFLLSSRGRFAHPGGGQLGTKPGCAELHQATGAPRGWPCVGVPWWYSWGVYSNFICS
jgi:hypothetical protein